MINFVLSGRNQNRFLKRRFRKNIQVFDLKKGFPQKNNIKRQKCVTSKWDVKNRVKGN